MSPSVKSLKSRVSAVRPLLAWALAAAGVLGLSAHEPARAAGTVTVDWVKPEQYSDAGRGPLERERTLKTLTEFFASLGRDLPDGQALKVEVLDLDLAGELRPAGLQEVRVMRGAADWPHMSLNYTLTQGGQTLRSGKAKLADMNYLQGLLVSEVFDGGMPYERHMVRQWFDETFPHPKP